MYSELIDRSIGKVYQTGVATKILQYMGKIRNESDITQARRWVMELLQNARDLAFTNKAVDVQFTLEENHLIFRHNGKHFQVKDVLSIINQVSSKNPGEGVGQFGTGFMTTYQLSEKVEIHSMIREEGYPGKEFRITLDRSGNTKEEILRAIEKSLQELRQVDEAPECTQIEQDREYSTEFCYRLESENSRRIARTGMMDLADTILYVMLFSEKIGSVELVYHLPDRQQSILYRRLERVQCTDGTEQLTLLETGNLGEEKQHTLFSITKAGLTLAAEYDERVGFLPVSERTPRLFVDFPLIGAEQFPFPVVLNHLKLCTNEPRSGISLVDNIDSTDAQTNKEILRQAVTLYGDFIKVLLERDYRGIEHLLQISEWKENKEWSKSWVRQHLYQDIFQIIRILPILPVEGSRISLADSESYLIQSDDDREAERIRQLLAPLRGYKVPLAGTDWYRVLAAYEVPEEKVLSLEKILEKAEEHLRKDLDEEKMRMLDWCSLLYQSGMQNPQIAIRIQSGNVAVFPNQSAEDRKECRLFTLLQVYQDPGIPEILKDVAEKLARLDYAGQQPSNFGIRNKLLHSSFVLEEGCAMAKYEITNLTEYIAMRSNRSYRVQNFSAYSSYYLGAWKEAWYLMLACGPDEDLYRLCSMVWGEELPQRQQINDTRLQASLWSNSYRSVLSELVNWIETQSDRNTLLNRLTGEGEEEKLYWWLNCCYDKLNLYFHSNDFWFRRILVNQEGKFMSPAELKMDRVREEELKSIAASFRGLDQGCDVYAGLLDKKISMNGWNLPLWNNNDIAMKINSAVQKLLSETNLSQAEMVYQEACTQLLGWIQEHPALARDMFPNFSKEDDQMKLLTPGAAVSLQRKAKKMDQLYAELGVDDPEELLCLLKEAKLRREEEDIAGMWLDEMDGLSEMKRADLLREIGDAGEEYAYRSIREYFLAKGYQMQSEEIGKICLSMPDSSENRGKVEILRPDMDNYHQAGWDIRVLLSTDSGETMEEYYLEVKTHVPKSVAWGILNVSNEQMKMAAEQGDHYVLLSVVYDFNNKKVCRMDSYRDLIRCLAEGKIYHAEGKYLLRGNI